MQAACVLIWRGRLPALPVFAAAIAGEDCRVVIRVQRMKTGRAQRAATPGQAWVGQGPIRPPNRPPGRGPEACRGEAMTASSARLRSLNANYDAAVSHRCRDGGDWRTMRA